MCYWAFICILGSIPAAANETEHPIRWGDVDLNGRIDAADALLVLKYAVGKIDLTPEQVAVADCSYNFYQTEDHKGIDVRDALLILQYSASTGPFKCTFPS